MKAKNVNYLKKYFSSFEMKLKYNCKKGISVDIMRFIHCILKKLYHDNTFTIMLDTNISNMYNLL